MKCPRFTRLCQKALTDSGAQSNLWSYEECIAAGFQHQDLIPVSLDLEAANKSPIKIEGALFIRLSGKSPSGKKISCAAMVYVSCQAQGFYLSMESMMDLGIISRDFPCVGAVPTHSDKEHPVTNTGCSSPSSETPLATASTCEECQHSS